MKVVAIVLAVTLTIFCFSAAVHFNQNVLQSRRILENERYTRLTAEESLEKAGSEIRNLENEIERAQTKIKSTEKLLEQTKSLNAQLQERVEESATLQKSLQQCIEQLEQVPVPMGQSNSKFGLTVDAGAT